MKINLESARLAILNIDYNFTLSTAIVFIPALSQLACRIQNSDLLSRINSDNLTMEEVSLRASNAHPDSRKFMRVHRWHAIGNIVQAIAGIALISINPLFAIPTAFMFYESYRSISDLMAGTKAFYNGAAPHRSSFRII